LLGLALTLNEWLRPILNSLTHPKSLTGKLILKATPLGFVVGAVRFMEHRVRSFISHSAGAKLPALTRWLGALAGVTALASREIAALSEDVYHGIDDLIHHRIPRTIRQETKPIDARSKAAQRTAERSISLTNRNARRTRKDISLIAGGLAALAARVHRGIDKLLKEQVIPRLRRAERDIATVKGHAIPDLRARQKALENEVNSNVKTRLKRLERWLGVGAIVGVVLRVLARRFPWLFCRNVARLGRTVCALDSTTMNGIIGLLLGTIALRDLRTLAQYAEAIEREMAEEVRRLVG
jgi:hypothetical protein